MSYVRTFVAVVSSYFVYAFASMWLAGVVMSSSGAIQFVYGLLGLALVSLVAVFMIRLVSDNTTEIAFPIVAGLIVLATAANMIFQLGAEPTWYKITTLAIVAPGIAVAGFLTRTRRLNRESMSTKTEPK